MTAKEYLSQIHYMDERINILIQERDALKSRAQCNQSPQMDADKVSSSGGSPAPMADAVDRYVDIEREIDELMDEYGVKRWKIVRQIESLPDPRHRELLYLRYVKWKRLEDIACIMRKMDGKMYSYKHIQKLHGWALVEFSKRFLKCGSNAVLTCNSMDSTRTG